MLGVHCRWTAAGIHLSLNDVEHVSSVSSQPVGNPDVHRGAGQPAGPLVYGLETHRTKSSSDGDEDKLFKNKNVYFIVLYLKYLESQIERLKVAFYVFHLDETRRIDGVSIHK